MWKISGRKRVASRVLFPFAIARWGGLTLVLVCLAFNSTLTAHAGSYALGASTRLEGPAAGNDSVILAVTSTTATWSATAGTNWLHITAASENGSGSTNVLFSYDANPGGTRSGTITIAGQALTVIQAGATYKRAGVLTALAARGLGNPQGVAVNATGDIFVADPVSDRIFELPAGSTNLITLAGSVAGLVRPLAVAVDGTNNLYIADAGNGNSAAIYELPQGAAVLKTLVAPGGKVLVSPQGVAVDSSGTVYIADPGKAKVTRYPNAMIYKLPAGGTLTNLVPKGSLGYPTGVAVDGAHNVYIADAGNAAIYKWPAAGGSLATLVSSGLTQPSGVAVDAATNIYIADAGSAALYKLTAGGGSLATVVSAGLTQPSGVAVDGAGHVYISDSGSDAIYEQPTALAALITVVPAGLNVPQSVAVDALGDIFVADAANDKIFELPAGGTTLTILADAVSGLVSPVSVAVDGANNLYIADNGNQAVYELANGATSLTNVAAGLNDPVGVAVDAAGNVYIVDSGDQALYEVPAGTTNLTTLVSSGLSNPASVAVDAAGNVYIADNGSRAVYEVLAGTTGLTSLVTAGLNNPAGLTVDGAGDVYIADDNNRSLYELPAGASSLTLVVTNGLNDPSGVAIGGTGNLYVADGSGGTVYELPRVLVDPSPLFETVGAGSDALPAVLPTSAYLGAPFAPASGASWLTLTGASGGVVAFSFTGNVSGSNRTATITLFGQSIPVEQFDSGTATQVLLTLPGETFASGSGNSGTVSPQTAGVPFNITLSAVDASGLLDPTYSGVKTVSYGGPSGAPGGALPTWSTTVTFVGGQATNVPATLVAAEVAHITPAIAGLTGVASASLTVTAAAASGVAFTTQPSATTAAGAPFATQPVVSIEDAWGNVVTTGADATQTVVLALGTGTGSLSGTVSVAASAGVATFGGLSINMVGAKGLIATASLTVGTRLAATSPAFNITAAGLDHFVISPIGSPQTTAQPFTIATITAQDSFSNTVTSFNSTVVFHGSAGITGTSGAFVSGVLTGASVTPTVAGYNLTVTVSDGGTPAHVGSAVIGTIINPGYSLGLSSRWEGPAAGTDSVVLAVSTTTGAWTATNNAAWLHVTPASQSGTGSTNVMFSFDANAGATRTSTFAIGGQTLTVIQAGATYVAAGQMTALANAVSGLGTPEGVAVDAAGNVYIADASGSAIYELPAGATSLTSLVSTGLNHPAGIAVDAAGNVYVADSGNGTLFKWHAGTGLSALVSAGLGNPVGVAVDAAGNVYVADEGNSAIYELAAGDTGFGSLVELTGAVSAPVGVALDAAGNVYIADAATAGIYELRGGAAPLVPLVSSGLGTPAGVAVDGAGNVYIADSTSAEIFELAAGGTSLTSLTNGNSGLTSPAGIAVDGSGNIYFSGAGNHAVYELPHVFVDPTARGETYAAGSDALPVVLPATANVRAPFAPGVTADWLAITNTSGGVVTFSFSNNTNHSRAAGILLFGQTVPVTQGARPPVAGVYNVIRTAGLVLHISFANVEANWSDANGFSPTLAGLNMITANGVTLRTNSNQILYPASATNLNDQITYTITDPLEGTNTGLINVVVNPFVYGSATGVTVANGEASMTFQGLPGSAYQVQRSTDLIHWGTVATITMDNVTGFDHFTDNFSDLNGQIPSAAYYRLEWNP